MWLVHFVCLFLSPSKHIEHTTKHFCQQAKTGFVGGCKQSAKHAAFWRFFKKMFFHAMVPDTVLEPNINNCNLTVGQNRP